MTRLEKEWNLITLGATWILMWAFGCRSMGVDECEPRVINQLMEFMHSECSIVVMNELHVM